MGSLHKKGGRWFRIAEVATATAFAFGSTVAIVTPAAASDEFTVDAPGSVLNVRSGPAGHKIGQLDDGTAVRAYCRADKDARTWVNIGWGRYVDWGHLDGNHPRPPECSQATLAKTPVKATPPQRVPKPKRVATANPSKDKWTPQEQREQDEINRQQEQKKWREEHTIDCLDYDTLGSREANPIHREMRIEDGPFWKAYPPEYFPEQATWADDAPERAKKHLFVWAQETIKLLGYVGRIDEIWLSTRTHFVRDEWCSGGIMMARDAEYREWKVKVNVEVLGFGPWAWYIQSVTFPGHHFGSAMPSSESPVYPLEDRTCAGTDHANQPDHCDPMRVLQFHPY